MKNLTYGIFAFFLLTLVMQGCKKSGLTFTKGQITAAKLTLDLNEPDSLILVGAVNDSVQWSVTPASANTLFKIKNIAILKFSAAGSYTVTATTNSGTTASVSITVTNNVYVPSPVYTVVSYDPVEQITMVPMLTTVNGSKTMYFAAQTSKIYACGNSIPMLTKSSNGNNLSINFLGIKRPDPLTCLVTNTPLPAENAYFFSAGTALSFTPGTYPLTVTLNNVTYTGSIVITATDMTFNWNYTAGVIIAPNHLSL